jgi:predicted transcriptional regulator
MNRRRRMTIEEELGQLILVARKKKRYSLAMISKLTGVDGPIVNRYEKGQVKMTLVKAVVLFNLLDIPMGVVKKIILTHESEPFEEDTNE